MQRRTVSRAHLDEHIACRLAHAAVRAQHAAGEERGKCRQPVYIFSAALAVPSACCSPSSEVGVLVRAAGAQHLPAVRDHVLCERRRLARDDERWTHSVVKCVLQVPMWKPRHMKFVQIIGPERL